VSTPRAWGVEYVRFHEGTGWSLPIHDCNGPLLASATAGTGYVEFLGRYSTVPCEITIDATFEFETDPVTMLSFTASELNVEGC
jgi:hypothetical protein